MSQPSIFIIGAGPQIASAVANLFASNGFSVGLSSRSRENLDKYAASLPSETKHATAVADAGDYESIVAALDTLKEKLGAPTVVVYNAASLSLGPKPLLELPPAEFEKHLSLTTVGGLVTGQWAAKNLRQDGSYKPTVIFTGGGLSLQPRPGFAGLAAGKAALLNLAKAFRVETKGIHFATVIVKGLVDKGDPYFASPLIAEDYWKLYEEKEEAWTFEVHH
ncbi:NAD(P)-binding protein [Sistotremastrum suecicum HHB10207 ss-3]|uniref:NAD(P)-binding protein n=1 Tax=Sistotremastrum suecicum HHB10207 ss-3 TaxID=1314776 RepID=A0A166HXZ5_9AGAM|nr:NAD(P)-binding protein [Sistotremastrum suecicum HHB10207 ss-3]